MQVKATHHIVSKDTKKSTKHDDLKPFTVFAKSSILDVWQCSDYGFAQWRYIMHHLSKIATHLSAQSSIDSRLIYQLLTPSQLKVKEGLLSTIEFDKYCKWAYMFQQS